MKEIVIVTEKGQIVRWDIDQIRPMSRGSVGVMGIRLRDNDKVVSAFCVEGK